MEQSLEKQALKAEILALIKLNKNLHVETDDGIIVFASSRKEALDKLRKMIKNMKDEDMIKFKNGLVLRKFVKFPDNERELIFKYGYGTKYRYVLQSFINGKDGREVPVSQWKEHKHGKYIK